MELPDPYEALMDDVARDDDDSELEDRTEAAAFAHESYLDSIVGGSY